MNGTIDCCIVDYSPANITQISVAHSHPKDARCPFSIRMQKSSHTTPAHKRRLPEIEHPSTEQEVAERQTSEIRTKQSRCYVNTKTDRHNGKGRPLSTKDECHDPNKSYTASRGIGRHERLNGPAKWIRMKGRRTQLVSIIRVGCK